MKPVAHLPIIIDALGAGVDHLADDDEDGGEEDGITPRPPLNPRLSRMSNRRHGGHRTSFSNALDEALPGIDATGGRRASTGRRASSDVGGHNANATAGPQKPTALPEFDAVPKPVPLPARLVAVGKEVVQLHKQYVSGQEGGAADEAQRVRASACGAHDHTAKLGFHECVRLYYPKHALDRKDLNLVCAFALDTAEYHAKRAEWLQALPPATRKELTRRERSDRWAGGGRPGSSG